MVYPPAPWTLKGYAFHTVQLANIDQARSLVPSEFHLLPVLPGKTLACVYLASYEPGSVLQYHELIVALLARYHYKIRFWISHIYVDNENSVAGGREIWGLPKQMAHFTWQLEEQGDVAVEQNDTLLCRIHCDRPRWLWPQPILLPVVSLQGPEVLSFSARTWASLGIASSHLEIPESSPLAALGLQKVARTYHHRDLNFVAQAPKVIGQSLAAH
ncbi:MAG TPA: acetoacetate decarboxylase family protein [Leptolyngbyaceae cyanobacterium M33_DOE_097]|nr:acetoacetate decarboxylase family protein [Leptolyngbyaceae cyanobacterium M33_DOE_097]